MANHHEYGVFLLLVALETSACTYGATELYGDGSEGTGVGGGGRGGGYGGGGNAGGSAAVSGGARGAASVTFYDGRASGAMSGYAWVALGAQDSLTSPTCDESASGGPSNVSLTSSSPCTGRTNWSSSNKLCVSGTIPVVVGSNYNDNWGISIGVNSSDPPATSAGNGTLGRS
jgi:hypothetical protein